MKYTTRFLAAAAVMAMTSLSANAALVAYYNLNETVSSTTIADSSGNNYSATGGSSGVTLGSSSITAGTYGAITVTSGTASFFGTSADFSGGKFDVGSTGSAAIAGLLTKNGSSAPTGNFTVMAWINSDNAANRFFLGSGSASNNGWKFGNNTQTAFVTVNVQQGLGTTSVSTTTWQHVAFTYSNGAGKFYYNGNLAGSVNYSNYNEEGTGSVTSIGARPFGGEAFDGQVDEVKIFDTALSESDVRLAAVPEPAAALLGGLGLLALLRRRRA